MGPPWGAFCQITLTSCYNYICCFLFLFGVIYLFLVSTSDVSNLKCIYPSLVAEIGGFPKRGSNDHDHAPLRENLPPQILASERKIAPQVWTRASSGLKLHVCIIQAVWWKDDKSCHLHALRQAQFSEISLSAYSETGVSIDIRRPDNRVVRYVLRSFHLANKICSVL